MSKIKQLLKFSLIISLLIKCSVTFEVLEDPVVCKDLRPQNGLDVSHTMGIWYGVELISHLKKYQDYKDYDRCIVVEISETTRECQTMIYPHHPTPSTLWAYALVSILSEVYSSRMVDQLYSSTRGMEYCKDLRPQREMLIDEVTGMWYAMEVVMHLENVTGQEIYHHCPLVHLIRSVDPRMRVYTAKPDNNGHSLIGGTYQDMYQSETDPGSDPLVSATGSAGAPRVSDLNYRHLRLLWEEPGNDIEYNLKFNASRRGFWMASGPHNAAVGRLYDSFAGVIQVLKAVGDHMVLTVCQVLPERQLHSIVLARHPAQLSREDIHGVHNLLARKDLSTASVRKLCVSSSHKLRVSGILIMVVACLSRM